MWAWLTGAKAKTMTPFAPPAKREFRVFVSSTFRDLREEREYLVKHVFPQIRARCEERAVSFIEVDLRWGLTEEQTEGDGTLITCLSEVDNCHPFFIGLLGERYGWVPASFGKGLLARHPWLGRRRGRSITELEILHRLQQRRNPKASVFFYFRDPKVLKRLAGRADRADFESQTMEERTKLAALKKSIRNSGFPVRENFSSPEMLGARVLADLTAALDHHFPVKASNNALGEEMARQWAFAVQHDEAFVVRERIVKAVTAHIDRKNGPLLVEGAPGMGKSALLAHVAATQGASAANLVLAAFAAATPSASNLDSMLRHVATGLKQALNLPRDLPEDSAELRRTFGAWLGDAAWALAAESKRAPRRLIVLIDGIDQLQTEEGVPDISWVPGQLPNGVSLLLSASDEAMRAELRRRNIASLEITAWDERERNALVGLTLGRFAKSLPRDLLRFIVKAPSSANPLYLRVLLEELRRHAEFETLPALVRHYLEAKDAAGLYARILERYENDYERDRPGLVRDAMSCLAAARNGLAEHELLNILGEDGRSLPRAFWSPLYLALSGALINRGGAVSFAHQTLRDAVAHRYLKNQAARQNVHAQLAGFFGSASSPVSERRRLEELAWQLSRARDWKSLSAVLTDPSYLARVWNHSRPDLLTRLQEWASGSRRSVAELFSPVVSAPASYPVVHVGAVAQILVRGHDKKAGVALQDHLLARLRASGERHDLAVALNNRALTAADEGDHACAIAFHAEQHRLLEGEGDRFGAAMALVHQARSHIAQGGVSQAEALLDRVVSTATKADNPIVLAFTYGMQADLARQKGDLGRARTKYQDFESLSRRARHLPGIIEANIAFAEMAAAAKNFTEADARAKTAAGLAAQSGDAIYEGGGHAAAARIAAERSDPLVAAQCYDRAIAAYERAGARHVLSETLANKGSVLALAGRFDEAVSALRQAETLARETGDARSLMLALSGRGVVCLETGDNAGAYQFFFDQAGLARAQNHYQALRAALGNMTLAAARQGDGAAAIRALDEEIALCLAHGDTAAAQDLRARRQSALTS